MGPQDSIRTFLIADIRGYSTFTRERGDEAAARLAIRFADLARDSVEARSGHVIEIRGDEALAVFESTEQAVRAAIEFQEACREATAHDPELPLPVGLGIDAGEAVAVGEGFRGNALNLAARLCARASAGQVLVTRGVIDAIEDGAVASFESQGSEELKGFSAPVELFGTVVPEAPPVKAGPRARAGALPPELDDDTLLADRGRELRWLRGTWRQARRRRGRVVFVSGPAGIGKTRLAAELARWVHEEGDSVVYAGSGGAAAAKALAALDRTASTEGPGLCVLDHLDLLDEVVSALAARIDDLGRRPVLVVGLFRSTEGHPALDALITRANDRGDGHRSLHGLGLTEVREIVASYAGDAADEAPLESILRQTAGIPARVHEAAADWARDEGGRRLAAAAEWLAQGRAQQIAGLDLTSTAIGVRLSRIRGPGDRIEPVEMCPYKGLAPFGEEDAPYFFGRERLVGELAARTVGTGLLTVAGPSGSGKSSLIMGGLLPSLAGGLLPGSERWRLETMRPGEHPERELEAIVASNGHERTLTVVDQFEETFTVTTDEGGQRRFLDRLAEVARDRERWMVVLTARGDYLGHLAPYTELADLVGSNLVLVGPMSPDELRRAIELPARRAGVRVESTLVEALVEEVLDEPGALPLLSTALVELWHAREDGWLRMTAYEQTGGVRGAVARLAEESFGRLDDAQREAARAVLLRLASGEGDSLTRRRVRVQEFEPETEPVRAAVLARFIEDRLLTASEDTVEVAHEALLREWPRLRAWLEEDAESRVVRQRLTEASAQWIETERDPSELFRGARLSAAVDWATLHGRELNRAEQEFLTASRTAAEDEVQRQRRTNRRLRGLLAGVVIFLIVALAAGILALIQRSNARHAAARAELAATVSLANTLGADGINQPRLDRGLLLAREAVNLHLSDQTKSDLLSTVLRNPQQIGAIYFGDTGKRPQQLSLSPDGKLLAVSFNTNDVGFYGASTLKQVGHVPAYGGPIAPLVFANRSPLFATYADLEGDLRLFDTGTLKPVRLIRFHQEYKVINYGVHTTGIFFSRDDRVLWWGFEFWPPNTLSTTPPRSVIESYSVSTGRLLSRTVVDRDWQLGVAPIAGGSRLVVVDRGVAFVYDTHSKRVLRRISLHGLPSRTVGVPIAAFPVAASPHGSTVAIGRQDGSVEFVSLRSGQTSIGTGGHTAGIANLSFTPDGKQLITVGNDNRVVVWNVATRTVIQTLLGHGGAVHGVATDGRALFTSSLDGTVFVWDLSQTRTLGQRFAASNGDFLFSPAFQGWGYFGLSPDGHTLAAPQGDGRVILWNIVTTRPRRIRQIHAVRPGGTPWVAFSPKGKTLLATDLKGDVALIDLATGTRRLLHGLENAVLEASFSPNGREVAASSYYCGAYVPNSRCYGQLALWNVSTGRLVHPVMRLPGSTTGQWGNNVAFSPSGASLAVPMGGNGGGPATWLIDTRAWKVTRRIEPDADLYAQFSPNGRLLVTTGISGLARLWDTRTGRELGRPFQVSAGFGLSLAFDPAGRLLATAGSDGTVRMFNVSDPARPVPFGPPTLTTTTGWTSARFTPNGSSLVTLDEHGHSWIWPMRWQVWAAHACAVAGRQLSRAEWSEFVGARRYRMVCP